VTLKVVGVLCASLSRLIGCVCAVMAQRRISVAYPPESHAGSLMLTPAMRSSTASGVEARQTMASSASVTVLKRSTMRLAKSRLWGSSAVLWAQPAHTSAGQEVHAHATSRRECRPARRGGEPWGGDNLVVLQGVLFNNRRLSTRLR
jgi:hypothetical protein